MPSYGRGWIACHHCIQDYHLLNWPIRNLPNCAKVFVVCPDCNNVLEFFAWEIDITLSGTPGEHRAITDGSSRTAAKGFHAEY